MRPAEVQLRHIFSEFNPTADGSIMDLCLEALERMSQTKDPLHDDQHIYRILKDLEVFLRREKIDVNLSALLLAICWHDTWKATRFPTKLTTMIVNQYWDGYGSTIIFNRSARKSGLDSSIQKSAAYAIREHGRLRFTKTKTNEAKILQDLDNLDEWSLVRIEPMKEKYLIKEPNPTLLRLAKFYFDRFMKNQTSDKYWFYWSKLEFKKRKEIYVEEVDRLLAKYGHLLKTS